MSDDTNDSGQQNNPPDDETLRRRTLFDAYWTEQQTRERANRDKYDNTILAYSTGALGLSITFIKDLVPLATAHALWTIKTSWVLFAVSLLLMLASFPIAGEANRQSVNFAHEYFINRKDDYYNKDGLAGKVLKWLNPLAGMVFFAACGFTIAFVWINVHDKTEGTVMTGEKDSATSSTRSLVTEGMGSAAMQVVHKGTPSAAMPAASTAAPAPAAPAPTQSSK